MFKAKILVVDDHPMVRDGLVRLIAQQDDLACCGEAATVAETYQAVEELNPDLIVLDLRLKGGDGLELIKALKSAHPQVKILILSQYDAPIYVERAMRAGAMGYLIKEQAAEEVLKAIRSVLGGEIYLSRAMATLLLRKIVGPNPKNAQAGADPLTDRELHVFQLLGAGLSTREIAAELNLSFKTVETHRENIKRKLNIRGASALVHAATEWSRQQVSVDHRIRKNRPPGSEPEPPRGIS